MRMVLVFGVALAVAVGCSKKSSPPSGKTGEAAEGKSVLERGETPDLSKLVLPPAEREQLAALPPAQILSLSSVTAIDVATARTLATFPGKLIILPSVDTLGAAEAEALAAWAGDTLVLGVTRLDAVTAGKLAQWKGKSLHLDRVEEIDGPTGVALASWPGTTLGVAKLRGTPEALAAFANFKGFVAISLTGDRPAGTPKGSPPSASTEEELATLGRMSKAVDRSDMATLREYLAGGGSPDINEQGTTLLMEATNMKQLEPAKLLIEKGANVNAANQDGHTPLYYALDDFQMPGEEPRDPKVVSALVHLLVEAGATVEPKGLEAGDRPLGKAVKRGDVELVKYLLGKGADPKLLDDDNGSVLIEAINAGNPELTKAMITAGAPVNVPKAGPGRSPLHQAVSQGASKISMARYDKKDAATVTALARTHVAIVDALLAGGADINARDQDGSSPLEEAINGGSPEILARVLDAKPKLDDVNDKGQQPLHYLAALHRLEEPDLIPLAKLLLARGADKKAKTKDGQTAAEIATKRKFTKLAAALR